MGGSPAEQVNVHKERATGDDLGLSLAAGQKPTRGVLRRRAHRANGRHRSCSRQHPADRRYRRRPRLSKGNRVRSWLLQDAYSNWLKLELTHSPDCSDEISVHRS